ncbi:hypothetical protein KKA17_01350 [bacterium]|nr:hypothetical protein [bacterium]
MMKLFLRKYAQKFSYLTKKKEQLQIVKFFIRILSQYQLTSELEQFKGYKKQLELEALIEEKKYFTFCLKRSLYSFTSLMVTLMISIVIFSSFFYILQEYFGCLSIELSKYTDTTFLNYIWNMVAYIFNIGEKLQLDSWHELLFMSFLKIYFYLLITYFIVKEITQKVEKI